MWDGTMAQAREVVVSRRLGDKPLVVLTAPDIPGFEVMKGPWLEMQRELTALSSDSSHRVLVGVGHIPLATKPEHAREVVEAIREVLDTVREDRRDGRSRLANTPGPPGHP